MANIDPFGRLMETERWISQDKLNRQQMARQNALQDIQQQSAQLGLEQRQGDAAFRNMLATNPQQARTDFKLRYDTAYPGQKAGGWTNIKEGLNNEGKPGMFGIRQGGTTFEQIPGMSPSPKSALVNIGGDGSQKAFSKKIGETAAGRRDDIIGQAQMANESRAAFDLQRATIKSGFETGAYAPFMTTVSSLVEGAGFDPQKLNLPDPAKGQVFDTATFTQLLNSLKAQKGPQTEGDAQRAMKTFAKMGNTTEANLFILDYLDELATRTEMKAEFTSGAENRKDFEKAEGRFRAWIQKHPAVAASKETGMPITYGQYKKAWLDNNGDPALVEKKWRQFSAR